MESWAPLKPKSQEKPLEFDATVSLIETSHRKHDSPQCQAAAVQACTEYLRNRPHHHWFCDPYIFPMASHILVLFSMPPSALTKTQWARSDIACCISQCSDCSSKFNRGKSDLYHTFAVERGIPVHQVQQVMDTIVKWEIELIKPKLINASTTPNIIDRDIKYFMFLCLFDPNILKLDPDIKLAFKKLIHTDAMDRQFNQLVATYVYLLFDDDVELRDWAISRVKLAAVANEPHSIRDEFAIYSYKIQNPETFSETAATSFWQNCALIAGCLKDQFIEILNVPGDLEVISRRDKIRYFTLLSVFKNHIRAKVSRPLPMALEFFKVLLTNYRHDLWEKPDLVGFNQDAFLVLIFSNDSFGRFIQNPTFTHNLIDWTLPFWQSLTGTDSIRAVVRIARFYLALDKKITDITVLYPIFYILIKTFNMKELKNSTNDKLDIEIGKLKDVRPILDDHSEILLNALENFNDPLQKSTLIDIICSSFSFDLSVLFANTIHLERRRVPKMFDSYPLLWTRVLNFKHISLFPVVNLFSNFQDICTVVNFLPRKDIKEANVQLALASHNQNVVKVTDSLNILLDKISMFDPESLITVFENLPSSIGFWSCLFSDSISTKALYIVYQSYDVQGRLEAVEKLLDNHFTNSMTSIIYSIKKLIFLEAFEPCPKIVRLLMDIIQCLAEPAEGLLSRRPLLVNKTSDQDLLVEFWEICWKFSIMIYRKTLQWASAYTAEQLIEFTRDNLDLSHLLLRSYGVFTVLIVENNIANKFIEQVINVFSSAMVWFKLQDSSLSKSCVELVFKGLDLAKQNNYEIPHDLIISMVKYGVAAKKYKTKLTEQQKADIIAKARELNGQLVNDVLEDLSSTKPQRVVEILSNRTGSTSSTPEVIEISDEDSTQPRITNFGSISRTSKPAPPPSTTPNNLSKLDLLRNSLKSSRTTVSTTTKKPTLPPAPARPSGFNKREIKTVRASTQKKKAVDDSDDSEADDEVDNSDIFVKDQKKPKIVQIGIDGKPITSSAKRIKTAAEIEREEQERMQLRLNVDLNGLYRQILKWNYSNSEFPGVSSVPAMLKDSYRDLDEYSKSTEPLLLLECWAQIQSSRERGQEIPFEIYLGRRFSSDGFFDLFCTVSKKVVNDVKLTETDLIVLAFGDLNPDKSNPSTYMRHPNTMSCLGKIKEIKSANAEAFDITIRISPNGPMLNKLGPGTNLLAMKVMPMITVEREYSSLKGLRYYDLCKDILTSTPAKPIQNSQADLEKAMKTFNVNTSQANAILGTQNATGFSLIQGPPGTGKTKTILGIVGYNLKEDKTDLSEINIVKSNEIKKSNKILICAPSNAAVDELVLRIKDGILNSSGKLVTPKVVRLGRSDAVNSAVKDCTLEELVEKQLSVVPETSMNPELKKKHAKLSEERNKLFDKRKDPSLDDKVRDEINERLTVLTRERNLISTELDQQRENATVAYRTRDIERRQIQAKILNDAQIICSTLSGSAHDFLASLYMKFNKVVIDEACQCVELSSIIPLRYGCRQCIMVGDPNQLPPTVLSQKAADFQYDQSLFVRIQKKNPDSVYLLDVQYRMHPEISMFPSREFYKGKLKNGEDTEPKNVRSWHTREFLSPYRFFNTFGSHEKNSSTKSLFNTAEANIALELVEQVINLMPDREFRGKIGIISPYKEQINVLKRIFRGRFDPHIDRQIDFNTVDGFQGQEKDIIIMSCVRANDAGGVGFLSDVRRMNVALTRAKSTLWVLGNANSLRRNKTWKDLIDDASSRGLVSDAKRGFLTQKATVDSISRDNIPKSSKHVNNERVSKINEINSKRQSEEVSFTNKKQKTNPTKVPANIPDKPQAPNLYKDPVRPTKSGIFSPAATRTGTLPKKSTPMIYESSKKVTNSASNLAETSTNNSNSMSINGSNGINDKTDTNKSDNNVPIIPSSSGSLPPRPKKKSSIFIQRKRKF